MEKVRFSLEEQVDFGGVGLILDATIDKIAEQVVPQKIWGKILLHKVT